MRHGFNLAEYDVIFLSYDEPNADAHYADLLTKIPWAKRVHGVFGSDAAHKAAAALSTTHRFIVVDADNIVNPALLNQIVIIDDIEGETPIDPDKIVLSWPSVNAINGLAYGNGGIKCWHKEAALNMKTHESADPTNVRAQVDFCWEFNYVSIDKSFSTVHVNGSKQQAWRAGFREGVKMCLLDGAKPNSIHQLDPGNLRRLLVWLTIGADVTHGNWAMLGARQGLDMLMNTDWNHIDVRDFDKLDEIWNTIASKMSDYDVTLAIDGMAGQLRGHVDLPYPLTPIQSKFVKALMINESRQKYNVFAYTGAYDIFIITYGEPNAEHNWAALKARFCRAQRINMVDGIHAAHKMAAMKTNTPYLWVVDGDAEVVDTFNFDYVVPPGDVPSVRVWRSQNPVNGLVYGYGGIKLLPRNLTQHMDTSRPDMTTSISTRYIPVFEVSNVTAFNTDAFSAWRSAFRECCKLSSKVIDRHVDHETIARLDVWCTVNNDAVYGNDTIRGALAGREYGERNSSDLAALSKINDFEWLRLQFNE